MRNDLIKRVQEAMKATERREHTEFASRRTTIAAKVTSEEIEMEDMKAREGKAKASV